MIVMGMLAVLALGIGAARLSRARARRRLRARLVAPANRRAPVGMRPRRRPLTVALVGTAGLFVAWTAVGPDAALAVAAAVAAAQARSALQRRGTQRRRRDVQLPDALDQLAGALRSGSSLTMALDEIGRALDPPIGPELRGLAREAACGRPLRSALDDWSSAHGDPGTHLAASALVLATVVGSAPARAIDGVATTVRERLDLAAERRALATQARTSALVLSLAPVAFAALLILGDTAAAGFLLGTPAGWTCLAAGAALDAAGTWWMSHLSRGDRW